MVDAANGVGSLLPFVAPLAGGRPIIAVATHGHFDHTGGLHEFDDRRCHEDDADDVRVPFQLRLLRERFVEGTAEIFEHYGYPVPDVAVSAVPAEGFDLEGWVTPGAEPTAFLGEGDVVDLGDRSFEVLHVPGHTAGSIALWEPAIGHALHGGCRLRRRPAVVGRRAHVPGLDRAARRRPGIAGVRGSRPGLRRRGAPGARGDVRARLTDAILRR